MIFQFIDRISFDPTGAVIGLAAFALALVVGITVHEFSHALSAFRLGDNTAKNLGRLTLNPRAHLDPFGTIMLVVGGFGWGKPTPVSPWNLRIGEKAGMAVVSIAGPISNLLIAFLVALPIRLARLDLLDWQPSSVILQFMSALIIWNIVLAAFNLLPIAPLDGFKIVLGLLPRDMALSFARTERYGPMVLILLVISGAAFGIPILGYVMNPIRSALLSLVLG
ncbi:MAG: site-2 protease family protein [Chloroflexi bacterium]|nr:site-2 protease family protein [Chloroflexota bacterium]MCH8868097.1 site-2 protease family protein [Chloroflexota bacterium]MCH9039058.1 site-2 protease family protein [Chloroflexota bacterium]MCI0790620.1 site-2 protease family protein [Chloroflexota bacterium]MCI0795476.1 site-2 protease family protein [Chloroflexota bacterium]